MSLEVFHFSRVINPRITLDLLTRRLVMSTRRPCIYLLFAILFTVMQTQIFSNGQDLIAGRNVNMVSDDPFLQRQNEPSIAVSTLNSRHLLAGANDYLLIDKAGKTTEEVTSDAWLGVYKSYDGGQSWESDLVPGYSRQHDSPLAGMDAAADPTIRAGLNGWFYYSGIAFERRRNGRNVVFVARYRDNGSSIDYVDTKIIDEGTSGQFQDKPWIGTDKNNRVYVIYSMFLGELDKNIHDKILIARSENGGDTWGSPSKLSEGHQKNQGTTVAVGQNDGTLYVAWRRFASVNVTDAILIAKSDDHGITFTKAEEVATIDYPFDQPTMGSQFGASQFRTNSYPTIAVDDSGHIYLAWTQRISALGDARIVITSLAKDNWGNSWPTPQTVENPFGYFDPKTGARIGYPIDNDEDGTPDNLYYIQGHQFMPTMVYGVSKLMLAWFDTRFSARRYDEFGVLRPDPPNPFPWIRDDGSLWNTRETVDVRLAQADPGSSPDFDDSIQVSRYLWVLEEDPDPELDNYRLRQGQFNPPNYKMFSGGTVPFHGDYIDIAHSPDEPFTFYVTWTDNRDVRPPGDDGFWGDYTPPEPFDPDIPCEADPNAVVVGMRNQNIYCSRITRGIEIGTLNNNQAPGDNSFVIFVNNLLDPPDPTDPYASLTFDLSISGPATASFSPEDLLDSITVSIRHYSTIVRQVFVDGSAGHTIIVEVSAPSVGFLDYIYLNIIAGGAPAGTGSLVIEGTTKIDWNDPELLAVLNPSITNPSITNPSITNPSITNPSIINPSIINPSITNPSIINPSITNPSITNPSIINPSITNPSIINPSIINPSITNANIINPSITNPSITNIPPGTRVADKVWSVHNEGDAVAAYTFKGIAGETLPSDEFIYTQLLIYQVHYTHSTDGCYLLTEAHHELLVNVISPILTTDTTGWTLAEINKFIGDPEVYNSLIENATFSLEPDEYAVLMLRVIDTKPNRVVGTSAIRVLSSDFTPAPITFDEAGSVSVPHASTKSNPTGSASLMILPDALPSGVKAGQEFPTTTLRAIGGILAPGSDYTWTHISGALPEDMTLDVNELSGPVRRIGPFSFTVKAKDNYVDPNPENPDASHFDMHTFSGEILPPGLLTLDMITQTGYDSGTEYETYSGMVTFKASGGVPQYFLTLTDTPVAPTTLPSGLSLQPTVNPGEMILFGTLKAGEWDITVKVTDDRLPTDATAFAEAGFTLCVSPLPLEINLPDAADLEWSLGTSHTVQITVSNAKVQPSIWTVTGLPAGFNMGVSGSPINLTGLPVFDPTEDYPATYPVTVSVTDPFTWCGFRPRTESAPFNIIVNPKAPEWDNEETNGGLATAVTADPAGNAYVTGYTGTKGNRDYFTVKYDPQGNREWDVSYVGPAGGDDVPRAIAADATGVYVTGFSKGTTSGKDIYTVKYNPDGSQAWEARYDGPSHMGDEPNSIALDGANIYVAGFVHRGNKTAHKDYTIIKYDKDTGREVWDARYDSRRNGMDEATAIAVDNSGNVYVTGKSQESSQTGEPKSFDYLTLKYNSSGRLQREVRDDGSFFGDDEPTAIVVDESGNIYITGQENIGANDTNFYTVKYNSEWQPVWSAGQSYGGIFEDRALGIAFDDDGNVYVTGKLMGTGGYDYTTIKYESANGNLAWDKVYGSGRGDDIPVGLAFGMENDTGFVFVAGFKSTESNGKDFFTIKYLASDGSIAWIAQHNSGLSADDEATAMFMNDMGLYVTGFNLGGFITVKYTK